MKRIKTKYPGVFYREAKRVGGPGTEKVFYIVFKQDGKVLEEKCGRQFVDDMTETRAARIRAERIEGKRQSRKKIREEDEASKQTEESRWTITRLWEQYKSDNPGIKALRIDEYRCKKFILPAFGEKEPKDLVPLDIDRVRLKLMKTQKPKTVSNVLELLRRLLKYGEKKMLIPRMAFPVQLPRVDNEKTEDLTSDEMQSLLQAIQDNAHLPGAQMMLLALYTGMRRGEMFRLRWKDIDFEQKFIKIVNPKGGKDQDIPLNEAAAVVIQSIPESDGFVFPGRDGAQRTSVRTQINRIKAAAGLPDDFRPLHGLRHVYASMLASSGQVDLYTLQRLLTHKSPQMTQRYAHLRDEALRKASNLAGSIIGTIQAEGAGVVSMPERNNA